MCKNAIPTIIISLSHCIHQTLYSKLSFLFNDTAPTEIYTLSLHDALPISSLLCVGRHADRSRPALGGVGMVRLRAQDRKSTRLNSSHSQISYAVFCLKKKKNESVALNSSNAESQSIYAIS